MALYDQTGKITIDEVAARKDIEKLQQTSETLTEVYKSIELINSMVLEFDNLTNKNIIESCSALKRSINNLKEESSETSKYIDEIVKKYQRIDQQIKAQIQ